MKNKIRETVLAGVEVLVENPGVKVASGYKLKTEGMHTTHELSFYRNEDGSCTIRHYLNHEVTHIELQLEDEDSIEEAIQNIYSILGLIEDKVETEEVGSGFSVWKRIKKVKAEARKHHWVEWEVEPEKPFDKFRKARAKNGIAFEQAVDFIMYNYKYAERLRFCEGTYGNDFPHYWVEIGSGEDTVVYDGETQRFYNKWLLERNANLQCTKSYDILGMMYEYDIWEEKNHLLTRQ